MLIKLSRMRKGKGIYLVASAVTQLCTLLRYAIVARLVGPEQLGIAVIITLTAQFFDSVSDSGMDRLIISDKMGNSTYLQRSLHSISLIRGAIICAALITISYPLSKAYEIDDILYGIVIISLSPLILSFVHLDYRRVQRNYNFYPESICIIFAEFSSLILTLSVAWIKRDYTALLYGIIIRSAVFVYLSHLTASRYYRIGINKKYLSRIINYSSPLIINGFLLFIGSHSDRIIISNSIGIECAGLYSATILLIYYPTMMISKYISTIYLPILSSERERPEIYRQHTDKLGSATFLLGTLSCLGFTLVAPYFIPLIYGERFDQPLIIIALISVLQSARFMRLWPTVIALSHNLSRIVLVGNIIRLSAVICSLGFLYISNTIESVIVGFIIGEILSFIIAYIIIGLHVTPIDSKDVLRYATFLFSMTCMIVLCEAIKYNYEVYKIISAVALLCALGFAAQLERKTIFFYSQKKI